MMMKLVNVLLMIEVVHMAFYIFKLALVDDYRKFFLTEIQRNCGKYSEDPSIFDIVTPL